MTGIATGPGGQPLLSLTKDEKAAEEQQAAVFLNGQHDEADRRREIGDRIIAEEMTSRT